MPDAPIRGFFDYLVENFNKEGLRDIVVKQNNKVATMGNVVDAVMAVNEAHAQGEYAELIEQMSQYWYPAEDRVLEQQIFRKIGFAIYPSLEAFIQYNVGRREFSEALRNAGYDGVVYDNREYVAFEPNQIKSADPVTYDDNGNDIPLSERFNPAKEDIRYSLGQPTDEDVTFDNFFERTSAIFTQITDTPTTKPDYISRTGSTYWYGEDERGKYVIRRSDHWSAIVRDEEDAEAFNAKPDDFNNIASCYWALDMRTYKPQSFAPINKETVRSINYNSGSKDLNIVFNDGKTTRRRGVEPRDMRKYFELRNSGDMSAANGYVVDMVNELYSAAPMPTVQTAKAYLDEFTKWSGESEQKSEQKRKRYSVQEVNDRFNEELAALTEENARERILNIGIPSPVLLACGIENKPIRLYGAKLLSKVRKHGYNIGDLKILPLAISEPIAVFKGSMSNSFAILTELLIGDNNVLATLSVGKGGHDVDFNIISSVYDKRGDSVVRWVNDGKLLYVDKEKALDYFSVSAPLAEAQNNQELISTTKVIQNFENPKIEPRFSLIGELGAANLDKAEEATKRLDNLAVARDMETAGKDAKTIKLATGWERGADGKWRYEIDDAVINQNAMFNHRDDGVSITLLGELLTGGELLKAYPQLDDMVVVYQELPLGTLGGYSPANKLGMPANIVLSDMFLSRRENPEWRAEVERMEQEPIIKAWSDAMMAEPYDYNAYESAEQAFKASPLWEEYNNLLMGKGKYPRLIKGIGGREALLHEVQHAIQDIEGFAMGGNTKGEDYNRLAGEVEARNVEKRANMTTQERLASLAEETEDVAREDQIILREGTKMAMGAKFSLRALDVPYLEAVERGDMETAQRMVLAAAERTGYLSDTSYQGSLAFNGAAPMANAYFDTKEQRKDAWDNEEYDGTMSLGDYADNNIDTNDLEWQLSDRGNYRRAEDYTKESIDNIIIYRAVPNSVEEGTVRNGDWVTPSRKYAEYHIELQDWVGGRIIEQEVDIDNIWWNGDDINEWRYDDGSNYGYRNTPNNRKLLDPVTYDDNGNVIPLSERFNPAKEDVRYSISESYAPFSTTEAGEIAEQMRADGALPSEIYARTGWWWDTKGRMRNYPRDKQPRAAKIVELQKAEGTYDERTSFGNIEAENVGKQGLGSTTEEQVRLWLKNRHLVAIDNIRKKYKMYRDTARLDLQEKQRRLQLYLLVVVAELL